MPRILSNMAMSHLSSCDHQGGKPSGLARISQHASEPMEPLEAVFFGVSYGPMGSRTPSYQRSMGPKKVLGLWSMSHFWMRRSSWRTGKNCILQEFMGRNFKKKLTNMQPYTTTLTKRLLPPWRFTTAIGTSEPSFKSHRGCRPGSAVFPHESSLRSELNISCEMNSTFWIFLRIHAFPQPKQVEATLKRVVYVSWKL